MVGKGSGSPTGHFESSLVVGWIDGIESPAGKEGPEAQPTRRSIFLRIALLIAIVGFVFVVLLPRVVDYDAVRAALAGLTAGQLAALVGATTVAYVLNAGPARVLVPGLTWRRAVEEDLVGRAVASTIPGPSDVAIKSVLFGQWKIPLDSANAGLFLASLFEPLSSLVLPLIATIGETPAAAAVSLCRGQSVRDSLALTLGRVDATQRLL